MPFKEGYYFSIVHVYIQRPYIVSDFRISNILLTSILLERGGLTAQFPDMSD